jgi:hypothetical protein
MKREYEIMKRLLEIAAVISIILINIQTRNSYGAEWITMNSETTENLSDICGNSETDVFAVGENGIIIHYDGLKWSVINSGITNSLNGVWCISTNDVIAVGEGGVILHYDGNVWSPITHPYSVSSGLEKSGAISNLGDCYDDITNLSKVWGISETDFFSVGLADRYCDGAAYYYQGTILHYDRGIWSIDTYSLALSDIWGDSKTNVFTVGEYGLVLNFDGNSWNEIRIGAGYFDLLHGVWGSSSDDVFIVGQDLTTFKGIIFHFDGIIWSEMNSDTLWGLYDIWGSSENDIFAVGEHGAVLHFDGYNWSSFNSGTIKNLSGIWGVPSRDVFVVGDYGTILRYEYDIKTTTTTSPLTSTTTSASSQPCAAALIYGEHSEEVQLLRYFRDNVLSNTVEGREVIRLYYLWSPVIMKAVEEDEAFKHYVREIIDDVLAMIK